MKQNNEWGLLAEESRRKGGYVRLGYRPAPSPEKVIRAREILRAAGITFEYN
jgi:hypothetical protein